MRRLSAILGNGDERLREWLVLLLILAAALVLRVWGLGAMEPHPDARLAVSRGMQYLSGDFNPRWFGWPGQTVMWLSAAALGLFFLLGRATGRFAGWDDFLTQYGLEPQPYYVAARAPMVIFALGGILLTYKLARRLLPARGALAATAFLAFSLLYSMHSQYVRPDIVSLFFLLLTIHFAFRISDTGRLSRYLAAGACLGAAVATKWVMAPVFLAVMVAHRLRPGRKDGIDPRQLPERAVTPLLLAMGLVLAAIALALSPALLPGILGGMSQAETVRVLAGKFWKLAALGSGASLVLAAVCKSLPSVRGRIASIIHGNLLFGVLGAALLTFLLCAPYALLDYKTLLRDLAFEARTEQLGAERYPLLRQILWYVREPMGWGFGLVLQGLALLGLLVGLSRKPVGPHGILLPFPLLYGLFVLSADLRWSRWVIHLLPFAAIYAGVGLSYLIDKTTIRAIRFRPLLMVVAVVALSVLPVTRIVRYDQLISMPDSRRTFVAWAVEHLPPGTRIAQEALAGDLPAGRYELLRELGRPSLAGRTLEDYREEGWEILVVSGDFFGRYFAERDKYPDQTRFYDRLFAEGELLAVFESPEEGWPPREERLSRYHIHFSPEIRVYRILPAGNEAGSH